MKKTDARLMCLWEDWLAEEQHAYRTNRSTRGPWWTGEVWQVHRMKTNESLQFSFACIAQNHNIHYLKAFLASLSLCVHNEEARSERKMMQASPWWYNIQHHIKAADAVLFQIFLIEYQKVFFFFSFFLKRFPHSLYQISSKSCQQKWC